MLKLKQVALSLFVFLVAVGCASTKVTDRDQVVTGKLPRPGTIWVYDFAATPADLPIETSLDKEHYAESMSHSDQQVAEGRKLGAEIETELVYLLRNMGLNAEHAVAGTQFQGNDLVIQGYILSYNEGDAKKRVMIGLGKGSSHLSTAVEGLQMTANGLRLIGSGATESGSSKTPGAAVGLATLLATKNPAGLIVSTGLHVYDEKTGKSTVEGRAKQTAGEIAEQLEQRFKEQGWI
jgi:hypothetical protein